VEASYARFHNLPTARVGNASGGFVPLTDAAAGQAAAARLGYAPLPEALREKVAAAVDSL
jgi:hypothetical protein